jgi:hypothetical protein
MTPSLLGIDRWGSRHSPGQFVDAKLLHVCAPQKFDVQDKGFSQ